METDLIIYLIVPVSLYFGTVLLNLTRFRCIHHLANLISLTILVVYCINSASERTQLAQERDTNATWDSCLKACPPLDFAPNPNGKSLWEAYAILRGEKRLKDKHVVLVGSSDNVGWNLLNFAVSQGARVTYFDTYYRSPDDSLTEVNGMRNNNGEWVNTVDLPFKDINFLLKHGHQWRNSFANQKVDFFIHNGLNMLPDYSDLFSMSNIEVEIALNFSVRITNDIMNSLDASSNFVEEGRLILIGAPFDSFQLLEKDFYNSKRQEAVRNVNNAAKRMNFVKPPTILLEKANFKPCEIGFTTGPSIIINHYDCSGETIALRDFLAIKATDVMVRDGMLPKKQQQKAKIVSHGTTRQLITRHQ